MRLLCLARIFVGVLKIRDIEVKIRELYSKEDCPD
jgi:hypothetical protein